jgi:hypothetical protein
MGRKKPKKVEGKSLVTAEQLQQQQELTRQATESREQEIALLRQQTEQQQRAFEQQIAIQQEQAQALEQSRQEQATRLGLLQQEQVKQQELLAQNAESQSARTRDTQARTQRTGNRALGLVGDQRTARRSRQRQSRNVRGSSTRAGGSSLFRVF